MPSKRKTYDKTSSYLRTVDNNNITIQCHLIETLKYDEALHYTGYGKMNIIILLVCSLGLLAVGFQNGVTAYLLPFAKCDLNMSSTQMGYINVAFMIGGILSACLWGTLSDIIGIRTILIITFLCDGLIGVLSILSQNHFLLLLCRFLSGFFIGGPGCLIFSYMTDFTNIKHRSKYTSYIGFSFIVSWILLPILGVLILPIEYSYAVNEINILNSWRIFLLLVSLPSLLCAICFYKLPESPKLLLQNGYTEEAVITLRNIFSTNTGKAEKYYLVENMKTSLNDFNKVKDDGCMALNKSKIFKKLILKSFNQTIQLFNKDFIFNTIILCIIFFINMFGCYGLGLWIPDLLIKLNYNEIEINKQNITALCDNANLLTDYKFIYGTILIGVICLIYNLINSFMSKYVGVGILSSFSLFVGSITSCILLLPFTSMYLPAASFFQASMTTGNILLVAFAIKVYPSTLRSMAVCVLTMCGRVGSICSNLLFGSNMNLYYNVPILLVSILSMSGCLLVCLMKYYKIKEKNIKIKHERNTSFNKI